MAAMAHQEVLQQQLNINQLIRGILEEADLGREEEPEPG